MALQFCGYEHLGGCSNRLTHRVEYWLGLARKQFGRHIYFCAVHAPEAAHLGPSPCPLQKRYTKAAVIAKVSKRTS
jgi:hypothetical protein